MKRFYLSVISILVALCISTAVFAEKIKPIKPVPDYVKELLKIASAEVGYTERSDGFTKYGAWLNDPYAQWCAEFLCWSVNETDKKLGTSLLKKIYPLYGGQNVGMRWFINQGRYISRTGFLNGYGSQWNRETGELITKNSYIPQPGDWAFFSYTPSGDTTHVAMVEFVEKTKDKNIIVHVIEGNNPDKVQRNTYKLSDWRILGYGTVHNIADFTLKRGSEGEKVRELQEKLSSIHFLNATNIDGKFGLSTENAVKAFQTQNKLEVNGIANYSTQKRLNDYIKKWFSESPDGWVVE